MFGFFSVSSLVWGFFGGIGKLFSKYPTAFVAVSLILIIVFILWRQNHNIERLEREKAQVVEIWKECADTNSSNLMDMRALEAANRELARKVTVTEAEREAAEADARRRAMEAEAALAEALGELQDLRNVEESCREISGLDIGAACPSAVDRLRQRARDTSNSQD